MTKVLVFESDHAFAGELRTELSRLGCTVQVVDDGNVGLQAAATAPPNLILLSIELPRMNGFSVCNKLKKDPQLKDVPLIIMSSESSDDTFEQHKKLRTRAEDYVHKPIALGELLEHIRRFVAIGERESESEIVMDDAIELLDDEPEGEESPDAGQPGEVEVETTQTGDEPSAAQSPPASVRPPPSAPPPPVAVAEAPKRSSLRPPKGEDREIDDFLGGAFDRLLGDEEPVQGTGSVPPTGGVKSAPPKAPSLPPPAGKKSMPPAVPPPAPTSSAVAAAASASAAAAAASHEEANQLRSELQRAKDEVVKMSKEVAAANAAVNRLENEASQKGSDAETDRLHREIEDLKHRLTTSGGKGGVSSKEFLDLREALNKKDKELIGLRQEMSRKEKELVELRDINLSLEREKADQVDKILEIERARSDLDSLCDSLRADKELANKRADDFKARLEKTQSSLALRETELAQAKQAAIESDEAHQAAAAAAAQAAEERLSAEKTSHREDVEAAKKSEERALAAAKAEADETRERALTQAQETHDRALAQANEAHDRALTQAKETHERTLAEARESAAQVLLARERELEQKRESALSEQRAAHHKATEEAAADFAGQKQRFEGEIADLRDKLAASEKRGAELEETRKGLVADVDDTKARLGVSEARGRDLESTLETRTNELEARSAELVTRTSERDTLRGDLDKRTAELSKTRDALGDSEEKGAELDASLKARTQELEKARADIAELGQSLTLERARLEKARAKWGEDRASLDRAKEALGSALARISETEQRSLED